MVVMYANILVYKKDTLKYSGIMEFFVQDLQFFCDFGIISDI